MKRHIVSTQEKKIFAGLRGSHPTVPAEVLDQEARYRFGRLLLDANEAVDTQETLATQTGYSVSQVERIIRAAKKDRAAGRVPPLAAWQAHDEAMRAEPKEAAPEPEAADEGEEEEAAPQVQIASLRARIKALMDAREDDADDDDGPRPVYAVTPHTHYRVRDTAEFIVVDHMPWIKQGAQVSFMATGLFGPRPVRRTVLSIQGMHRFGCLSLQVGEPSRI